MKRQKILLITLAALLSAGSLFLFDPVRLGLCTEEDILCFHKYIDWTGPTLEGTFYFSIVVGVLNVILLFLRDSVFLVWKRFTYIYIPISIILIATTPTTAGLLEFDKESATWALSILFFISSILLFIIVSLRGRKK